MSHKYVKVSMIENAENCIWKIYEHRKTILALIYLRVELFHFGNERLLFQSNERKMANFICIQRT